MFYEDYRKDNVLLRLLALDYQVPNLKQACIKRRQCTSLLLNKILNKY